jgi:hypothetical protein
VRLGITENQTLVTAFKHNLIDTFIFIEANRKKALPLQKANKVKLSNTPKKTFLKNIFPMVVLI